MHKFRLLRIFLLSLFDTRPADMVRPVTCRFMVSPFDVELTHASSHTYMAYFEHRMTQGRQVSAIVYSRGECYAAGKRIPIDQCSKGA